MAAIKEEKEWQEQLWKQRLDTQQESVETNSFDVQSSSPNKTINESIKSKE